MLSWQGVEFNVEWWPRATEIDVRSHVGNWGQSGLDLLSFSFVADDPKADIADLRDNLISLTFLWLPFAYKLLGFEYLSLAHLAGNAVEIVYRALSPCAAAKLNHMR